MQANLAIDEADLVLFVVDGKDGLTSDDYKVRDMLQKINNKVIVVINKCDSKRIKDNEQEENLQYLKTVSRKVLSIFDKFNAHLFPSSFALDKIFKLISMHSVFS